MPLDPREGPIVKAVAPSNIAFAKYWGKSNEADQWPANDSLSMTLRSSTTTTRVQLGPVGAEDLLWIDGQLVGEDEVHGRKAFKHLRYLKNKLATSHALRIDSFNSFPKSCGIASSASGMAALTLGFVSAVTGARDMADLAAKGFDRLLLAQWARMGSGSAGRSLFGGYVAWQRKDSATSQTFQQLFPADGWDLSDLIVVLSGAEKPVSSSEAHRLAWTSPLFSTRLAGHEELCGAMTRAIAKQDMDALGPLLEAEALNMHAVAMTSQPSVTYITEDTTAFLVWLRRLRTQKGWPAYFTLDAGCNVHVICPSDVEASVRAAMEQDYPGCQVLVDGVGHGPFVEWEKN